MKSRTENISSAMVWFGAAYWVFTNALGIKLMFLLYKNSANVFIDEYR